MSERDSQLLSNAVMVGATEVIPSRGFADENSSEASYTSQRQFPRFLVDMPVQVRVTTQGPTRILACDGQGMDLSIGGMAIRVDMDLAVGDQIAVEFRLPGSDQPTAFRSFIRNRDGAVYGVEFITENDEDYAKTAQLEQFLARKGRTMNGDERQ